MSCDATDMQCPECASQGQKGGWQLPGVGDWYGVFLWGTEMLSNHILVLVAIHCECAKYCSE